jgi:SAM-dependent methyltransferase
MTLLKRFVPQFVKDEVKDTIQLASHAYAREISPPSAELAATVRELVEKVADLEAAVEQLSAVLRHEGVAVPPPKTLQVRVVGGYVPGFIESGFSICEDLDAVLAVAGKRLSDFARILDFGCGCGRTARALKTLVPACELHGTDIDPEAINWLQKRYGRYGDFRLAPQDPPLPYDPAFFDFIFGISVFTHLPEEMQFAWLEELCRITRPGGLLILTTSGRQNYSKLSPERQQVMETKGFYYLDNAYGQRISLPAFYQNTFHAHHYIREHWSRYFEVLDIQADRMQTMQDTVLLRKR